MTTAAERDQGVAEPGEGLCWICDAVDPGPCLVHGEPEVATRCRLCAREAFARWLAHVGEQRICDGSGQRDHELLLACPGCAACCTAETACPAFAEPDEPWIPQATREAPCVFCGEGQARHRPMPPLPDGPTYPSGNLGLKFIDADGAELGTVGDVLRAPR